MFFNTISFHNFSFEHTTMNLLQLGWLLKIKQYWGILQVTFFQTRIEKRSLVLLTIFIFAVLI